MNLFYSTKDNCKIDEISEKIIELLVKEKITYAVANVILNRTIEKLEEKVNEISLDSFN